MTVQLAPPLVFQSWLSNGTPNAFGFVFTYIAGSTTAQATWVDATQTTQNQNPTPLNALGQASIWLATNLVYKIIVQDASGNQVNFQDQIIGGQNLTGIQQSGLYGTDSGAANAYVYTHFGTVPATLAIGTLIRFTPLNTNTGASTLNADGTGVAAIIGATGKALTGGELTPLGPAVLQSTGTQWQIVSSAGVQAGIANLLGYGADPAGVVDSRGALNTASTVNIPFTIPPGTYLVNSNVTVTPNVVFQPGAILKPAAGVTVTLSASLQAGVYQIFDLSLGGYVALPRSCGEVWGEWWGAKGDLVKTNNEVPLNQAWYALLQTAGSTYGGTVNLDRGDFLIQGTTYHSDNISLRGHGLYYTLVKATTPWAPNNSGVRTMVRSQSATTVQFTAAPAAAATSATLTAPWGGTTTTYPLVFFESNAVSCEEHTATLTNGSTSVTWTTGLASGCTVNAVVLGYIALFNARIEQMRIDANDNSSIFQVIYAPAWQQKSGVDNVYIGNFTLYGILIDNGYGGAAQLKIRRAEIFQAPDCSVGSYGIYINLPAYSTGWISVDLDEVSMGSAAATVNFTAAPNSGATSATLTGNWTPPSGTWNVLFVETSGGALESRLVTLTNGATTATWSVGLGANCNAAATGVSPNCVGIGAVGRVLLNAYDFNIEQAQTGISLQGSGVNHGGACLVGNSLCATGNPSVQNLLVCTGSWTGQDQGLIHIFGAKRGGATNFLQDNSRGPYPIANLPGSANIPFSGLGAGGGGFSDEFVWPPDPSKPFCAARVVGSSAAISYQNGNVLSCVHTSAGVYTFTMSPAAFSSTTYDVEATSDQFSTAWTVTSNSVFVITTKTQAGTATDCTQLSVKVYHSP